MIAISASAKEFDLKNDQHVVRAFRLLSRELFGAGDAPVAQYLTFARDFR